jgi:hypothetical protein
MKRTALATVLIVAALATAACAGTGSKGSVSGAGAGGTSSSGGSSGAQPAAVLDSFPTVSPESPNEKAVASKIDAYYASYVKINKPNATASNPIYTPPAGVKAQFIGYAVTAYSPKDAKGQYGALQVVVTGDHIQMFGSSQMAADLALGQSTAMDNVLKRRSKFNQRSFDKARQTVSAGEKHAVEVVKAWVAKNLAGLGYAPSDVALTGYVLFWGEKPDAAKSLYLLVQPDSILVQGTWRS